MTRSVCHGVPATLALFSRALFWPALFWPALFWLALLFLAGCFGSHGSEGAAPPADAGSPPADAGSPPACPEQPIDLLCDDAVTAGTPTTLPVLFGGADGCFCGETVDCRATIGDAPHTLELATGLCVDGPRCRACHPFLEGRCSLPALEAGTWTVRVDGVPAFVLDVAPAGMVPERPATCVHRASRDSPCGEGVFPPATGLHTFVCHPALTPPETRTAIEVTEGCGGGCGAVAGPCRVTVLGDRLLVRPSTVLSSCDFDCPGLCEPRTDLCWTPPLAPGSYRVVVEGIDGYSSTLQVGTPREPVTPATICGPVGAFEDGGR